MLFYGEHVLFQLLFDNFNFLVEAGGGAREGGMLLGRRDPSFSAGGWAADWGGVVVFVTP